MMQEPKKIHVLFVCLGNICRSPMAEAVFRQLVTEAGLEDRIHIESAGTGTWNLGEAPHRVTLAILRRKNIDLSDKRARLLKRSDLERFDYIIAMDEENVGDIQAAFGRRVPRLMDFVEHMAIKDVPDPYYTGAFDTVYDMVLTGSRALLAHIREKEGL
jgi:protein-tyrosine phosphatase